MLKNTKNAVLDAFTLNALLWVGIIASIPVAFLCLLIEKNPQVGLPIVISLVTPVVTTLASWYVFSDTTYKNKANSIAFSVGLISGVAYSWIVYF
jgi:hypothetical protein